ncbi:MAG: hypothetical protein EOO27_44895, partial [Comamonadaceae bacterium]
MALEDELRTRRVNQIPVGGLQAPSADGSQNNPLNTELGRNVTNTLSAVPGAGSVPGVAARVGGLGASMLGAAQPGATVAARGVQAAAPYVPVAGGALALNSAAGTDATSQAPATPPTAALGNPQAAVPPASPPGQVGARPTAAPTVSGPGLPSGVTRTGNSYSGPAGIAGDISVNGAAPGGGSVTAKNMAAAEALAASSSAGLGFGPTSQAPEVQVPTVRHSGNDWQSRNDLRNAAVSASSITNTRRWGGRGAENSPDVMAYRGALATDEALKASAPGLAGEGMRQSGATEREGLQQAGQNSRAGMRAGLDARELGMRERSQGYQD